MYLLHSFLSASSAAILLISGTIQQLPTMVNDVSPAFTFPSITVVEHISAPPPPTVQVHAIPSTARSIFSSSSTTMKTTTATEGYLPRKLYPGTYKNFCGPTPEIEVKGGCAVHGWHGDDPLDAVDDACRVHDISYCKCETELLSRHNKPQQDVPLLSSLTAIRFVTGTKPIMLQFMDGADKEYFDCIHSADQTLIAKGVEIRSQMQKSSCSIDPSLSWFCETTDGTGATGGSGGGGSNKEGTGIGGGNTLLEKFENINLNIFLKDLDFDDEGYSRESPYASLQALEHQRRFDLDVEMKSGKSLSEAAQSISIQDDESRLLTRLRVDPKR